jgi:dienelactone hydrolase
MSPLRDQPETFIFKPYRKPEGLNMASMSLLRLRRAAAGATLILAAIGGSALAGTNPLEDFNSEPLTESFRNTYSSVGDATVNVDVPYGLDGAQKYDVYLPASTSNAPIIVMVHGGAWTGGDKQADDVAEAKAGYFVSKGYIFVSLNYRLLPQSDPLIQAADVARGIANIQTNAAKWGGDKNKIVLMGSGAGGHLAALLSSNPSLASDQGAAVWAGAVVLETAALNVPSLMSNSHNNLYDTAFGANLEFDGELGKHLHQGQRLQAGGRRCRRERHRVAAEPGAPPDQQPCRRIDKLYERDRGLHRLRPLSLGPNSLPCPPGQPLPDTPRRCRAFLLAPSAATAKVFFLNLRQNVLIARPLPL